MNERMGVICVVACLLAVASATPTKSEMHSNNMSGSLKPSEWLKPSDLEDTPSLDELTLEKLEKMPLEKGAELLQKLYHISQINHQLIPRFVPSPSNIPVYIIKAKDKKETATLNTFVEMAKKDTAFGNDEITIFITGLPSNTETVKKANRKLVHAYIERYNRKYKKPESFNIFNDKMHGHMSSEESSSELDNSKFPRGNLIVIDLGQTLESLQRFSMLDVDETGAMIGKALVKLIKDCNVPHDIVHIIAQGIAAHVAGAAGYEYTRLTGHQLRRITALDPSKILAKHPDALTGLTRGDADFVDAIHTSVYGMGTMARVGDIDFFPNGPSIGVPGAENVIEASMRATRYFAESVRPGNERNFPAIEANSLQQYKSNNGFSKHAYMGFAADYDLKGDYILLVKEKSPFGMRAQPDTQYAHHGMFDKDH